MADLRYACIIAGLSLALYSTAVVASPFDGFFTNPFNTQHWVVQHVGSEWQRENLNLPKPVKNPSVHFKRAVSLAQLTTFALSHNPSTQVAYYNLEASADGLGVADSGYLPSISLSSSASRSQQNSTAGFSIPTLNSDSTSLSLSYVLLDFGAREAQRKAAKAQIILSGIENNSALQSVAMSVTENYYQLIGEEALVRAYSQTLKEDANSLASSIIKDKSGLATITDVLQAKAALSQIQAELIATKAQVVSDRGALSESCGLPVTDRIPIHAMRTSVLPPKMTPDVQSVIRYAIQHNNAVASDSAKVLSDRANIMADKAAGMPTLSLGVNGGYRFQNQLSPSRNWSIGVTLTVPIFSGFKHSYTVSEARADEKSAEASLNAEAQSTSLTVYQDYQTVIGARQAARAAQAAVISADASLKAIKAQYKVGLATMLDVLTAQAALTNARQTQIQDITTGYLDLANMADALGYVRIANHMSKQE